MRFLFDLIDEFGLERQINVAPALPILERKTKYLPLSKYKKMAKEMVLWSVESREKKISWYSDNGFILCGFTRKDLRDLRKNVGFIPDVNCYAAGEVRPNLEIHRCFGMWSKKNERPVSLKRFSTLQEAHRYFNLCSLIVKQRYGALKECKDCIHFQKAACGGGCMVYILKKNAALCNARIFS